VDGLLDENTALKASQDAQIQNIAFITYVVQKKILQSADIAFAASQDFGLSLLDLDSFDKELLASNLVSDKLINKHHAIPLYKRGDRLYVAISDPTNLSALNEFKFHTGVNTHGVLVEENKLSQLIEKVLRAQESAALGDLDSSLEEISVIRDEDLEITESDAEDAPIVRFVHKILLEAINKRVSDVHFEPYEKIYRIRYRLDGILYETATPPLNLAPRITARLKVMSRLDISERRLPQDGHFKMSLSKNRAVDFRVSTCPTISGEKVVVRILDPTTGNLSLDDLGMESEQKNCF
jgi:type IV pilus assembly protein PilB